MFGLFFTFYKFYNNSKFLPFVVDVLDGVGRDCPIGQRLDLQSLHRIEWSSCFTCLIILWRLLQPLRNPAGWHELDVWHSEDSVYRFVHLGAIRRSKRTLCFRVLEEYFFAAPAIRIEMARRNFEFSTFYFNTRQYIYPTKLNFLKVAGLSIKTLFFLEIIHIHHIIHSQLCCEVFSLFVRYSQYYL